MCSSCTSILFGFNGHYAAMEMFLSTEYAMKLVFRKTTHIFCNGKATMMCVNQMKINFLQLSEISKRVISNGKLFSPNDQPIKKLFHAS